MFAHCLLCDETQTRHRHWMVQMVGMFALYQASRLSHIVQSICKSLFCHSSAYNNVVGLVTSTKNFTNHWVSGLLQCSQTNRPSFFVLKLRKKSTFLANKMNKIAPITQWTKSKVLAKIVCDFSLLILMFSVFVLHSANSVKHWSFGLQNHWRVKNRPENGNHIFCGAKVLGWGYSPFCTVEFPCGETNHQID